MAQKLKLKCPVCQNISTKSVSTYINTERHPHLVTQLMNNELFTFECENCGAKRHLETQVVYHNPIDKFMIVVLPNYKPQTSQLKDKLNSMIPADLDVSNHRLRIVPSIASLIEKIQIFERDLNDQVVEIVKLLTDGLFAKEKPDVKVVSRYFVPQKSGPKILYITDDEQFYVDFSDRLVEFAENKYKKAVANDYKGEFVLVNQQWAANLLAGYAGPQTSESKDSSKENKA